MHKYTENSSEKYSLFRRYFNNYFEMHIGSDLKKIFISNLGLSIISIKTDYELPDEAFSFASKIKNILNGDRSEKINLKKIKFKYNSETNKIYINDDVFASVTIESDAIERTFVGLKDSKFSAKTVKNSLLSYMVSKLNESIKKD